MEYSNKNIVHYIIAVHEVHLEVLKEGCGLNKVTSLFGREGRSCKFNILRQQLERLRRDTIAVTSEVPRHACVHSSREGTLIIFKKSFASAGRFSERIRGWMIEEST